MYKIKNGAVEKSLGTDCNCNYGHSTLIDRRGFQDYISVRPLRKFFISAADFSKVRGEFFDRRQNILYLSVLPLRTYTVQIPLSDVIGKNGNPKVYNPSSENVYFAT